MEYPFEKQVLTQDATVIWSLEKLYPVRARAALSDTQPEPVHPAGTPELDGRAAEEATMLELDGWAAEEVATLELVVLAERTDAVLTAEEDRVDEATGMSTLVVAVGLAEEDTDDGADDFGTPLVVRRVSLAGPPQISFSAKYSSIHW